MITQTFHVNLRAVFYRLLNNTFNLLELFFELGCELRALPALHHQHHPQRLPRLVRPELVDEVVHVDEQQIYVLDLLVSLRRLRALYQDINQVEEVHQHRVVQFSELFLSVNIFR